MGIFEPFRAIGYITAGGVPFSVQRLGTETFVTVSVGKAFHVYNCAKLNLVLAGPQLPKKIRAIACYKDYTFAAYGSDIAVFKRTDQVATWSRHEEKVNMLYLFGEYVLSADAKGNIFMWAFRGAEPNSEPVGSISLGDKFTPTCIMHPDTYLNKVIVGSEEGPCSCGISAQKKKLYDFNGWNSPVRCCVSSPALDVVAVGCSDGSVHVHNIWIFDSNDGDARLLRFRSGHSAPPRCIRFYGNGKCILSAGQDRAFRLFSVIQDQQSRELSQRHVAKRAKRLRVKAYVWRLQNFVIGEHVLTPSSSTVTPIKACVISACGNFTILGTEGGWIEKFNLQSGFSRGCYIDTSLAMQCAHDGEVVGLACDATNGSLISAGYHGDIKLWDFKTCKLKSRLDVGKSVTKIAFHRPNGLLATVAGDMVLILFDTVSMKMVRRFEGHTDRITDLCFSEDGKWLISSSMDGTLRIWDISLARQIDAMHVDVSITSISMSPNMDVLATTHVDQNGVYLWVNQSLFSASTNTENYGSGKHVRNVRLPTVSSAERSEEEQVQNSGESYKSSIKPFVVMDHQIPNLVTLSLLPKSQWQSLTNLDIIKVRNKPIEPPKKPEKAPFFLPSVPSLSGEILFEPPASTKETDISTTKNTYHKMSELSSHFSQLLQSCGETKDYSAFTDYLKGLSPSSLDMELRMLQIIDDEESEDLEQRPELQSILSLLDYFIHELSFRNNFEFVQAVLKLFLKSKVKKLLEVQSLVWQKIDKIFQGARCMVTFLSNSQF
ncbi:unnamed protein product [Miscanthus lutarioriparius]|uniref:Uncharacterized protein n=1 Tax=Miscanthus lutarioriparius TaxID=422564 RepID=A0A811S3T5_9POAL|nr:unnamed protein product [Miscanthus lutarioriparius]